MPLIQYIYQRPDLGTTEPVFCNVHMMENNDKSSQSFQLMLDMLRVDFPEVTRAHVTQGRIFRSPDFTDFAILSYGVKLTPAQRQTLATKGWKVFPSVEEMMSHSWHSLNLRPAAFAEFA